MKTYLVLLRGINVGGKNKVPMAPLRELLSDLGYSDVSTYIASGNVILRSNHSPGRIRREIEEALPKRFRLDMKGPGPRLRVNRVRNQDQDVRRISCQADAL